jgi:tetratricopeptide (TPR) repeat protein
MKRYTLILIAGLLGASCDSLIDVQPQSDISTETFFRTPAQIDQAILGAYGYLQTLYAANGPGAFTGAYSLLEMRSDNTTYQFNVDNRGALHAEQIDEFREQSENIEIQAFWQTSYQGIYQTNVILDRIESVEYGNNTALKDQHIGEAKFLRAFNYFNLVRLFGGVPLKLHEIKTPSEAYAEGRASVDEVYAQILSDVQDAVQKLPWTYPAEQAGRATKGAALMLLAEVHMTRQNFSEARAALEQIVSAGIYELLPDYAEVFNPANKNHRESIFEIQYSNNYEGEEADWIFQFAPFNSGCALMQGPCQGARVFAWNIPTRDMLDAYEPGDLRKDVSIGWYEDPSNVQYDVAIGDSIPYVKKFAWPFNALNRTNENWPVYRYAETLLLLAEALNEEGRTAEAEPYLNAVRARAGLSPLTGLSQEEFRQAVWHEQRVELAFENKRWFQLLRTGRALDVMRAHGEQMRQISERMARENAYQIEPYRLLYPIPLREVILNNLEQNPGY